MTGASLELVRELEVQPYRCGGRLGVCCSLVRRLCKWEPYCLHVGGDWHERATTCRARGLVLDSWAGQLRLAIGDVNAWQAGGYCGRKENQQLHGGLRVKQAMRWACAAAVEFGPPLLGLI